MHGEYNFAEISKHSSRFRKVESHVYLRSNVTVQIHINQTTVDRALKELQNDSHFVRLCLIYTVVKTAALIAK